MTTEAFKRHIIPLQSHMQLLAERMLGDAAEAEDAVQEVFMRLWERREKLDKVVNLKSYVMQTTRMRCIDFIRERNTKAVSSLNEVTKDSEYGITDEEVAEEVELVERRSAILHSMLDDLPEKQRQIVTLRYLEEKEITQIERTMNMSSSNIYTTLSRVLQQLRERFKLTEP